MEEIYKTYDETHIFRRSILRPPFHACTITHSVSLQQWLLYHSFTLSFCLKIQQQKQRQHWTV